MKNITIKNKKIYGGGIKNTLKRQLKRTIKMGKYMLSKKARQLIKQRKKFLQSRTNAIDYNDALTIYINTILSDIDFFKYNKEKQNGHIIYYSLNNIKIYYEYRNNNKKNTANLNTYNHSIIKNNANNPIRSISSIVTDFCYNELDKLIIDNRKKSKLFRTISNYINRNKKNKFLSKILDPNILPKPEDMTYKLAVLYCNITNYIYSILKIYNNIELDFEYKEIKDIHIHNKLMKLVRNCYNIKVSILSYINLLSPFLLIKYVFNIALSDYEDITYGNYIEHLNYDNMIEYVLYIYNIINKLLKELYFSIYHIIINYLALNNNIIFNGYRLINKTPSENEQNIKSIMNKILNLDDIDDKIASTKSYASRKCQKYIEKITNNIYNKFFSNGNKYTDFQFNNDN